MMMIPRRLAMKYRLMNISLPRAINIRHWQSIWIMISVIVVFVAMEMVIIGVMMDSVALRRDTVDRTMMVLVIPITTAVDILAHQRRHLLHIVRMIVSVTGGLSTGIAVDQIPSLHQQ